MKFRWLKAASWIMAGILLMGCDGESNENPKTEPIVEQEKEEAAVSPTPEADSDTEEEKLEIELPESVGEEEGGFNTDINEWVDEVVDIPM